MTTAVRFTAGQFDKMIAGGVFEQPCESRVELVFGELRDMPPPSLLHEDLVDFLTEWSTEVLPRKRAKLRVQQTIGIAGLDSVPVPDIAWVSRRRYQDRRPQGSDVWLIIEVADSSLDYDLGDKRLLYCQARIKEYWVVSVRMKTVHVFRGPTKKGYRDTDTFSVRDTLSPISVPDAALSIKELFDGRP
jgi:Uma2 family endonuclease